MPGPPSPDPVSDPTGYQQHLLGLLGDDDPAQAQATTLERWREIVEEAGPKLAERPEPGEWSVLECLGHAVDAEIVSAARYRWIVAHDEPNLLGYDQALWVDRLRHRDEEPGDLLHTFDALRIANVALWERSSDVERSRVGLHAERGPESFDLLFRMIAGHDRFHLAQARRALDAVS
ncbi:MAG TPA: DinB family protein [Actinomycetota bacterium]